MAVREEVRPVFKVVAEAMSNKGKARIDLDVPARNNEEARVIAEFVLEKAGFWNIEILEVKDSGETAKVKVRIKKGE